MRTRDESITLLLMETDVGRRKLAQAMAAKLMFRVSHHALTFPEAMALLSHDFVEFAETYGAWTLSLGEMVFHELKKLHDEQTLHSQIVQWNPQTERPTKVDA